VLDAFPTSYVVSFIPSGVKMLSCTYVVYGVSYRYSGKEEATT
jgi:hypothetical protein